jgi:hypothetical protein
VEAAYVEPNENTVKAGKTVIASGGSADSFSAAPTRIPPS